MPVNPFPDPEIRKPNEKRIDKIYVGMSVDENGFNGICGGMVLPIGAVPMVTASEKVLKVFMEQAGWFEQRTGEKVHFFEFIRGAEIEDEG
jgi:hypothetical protein